MSALGARQSVLALGRGRIAGLAAATGVQGTTEAGHVRGTRNRPVNIFASRPLFSRCPKGCIPKTASYLKRSMLTRHQERLDEEAQSVAASETPPYVLSCLTRVLLAHHGCSF